MKKILFLLLLLLITFPVYAEDVQQILISVSENPTTNQDYVNKFLLDNGDKIQVISTQLFISEKTWKGLHTYILFITYKKINVPNPKYRWSE